MASAGGDPDIKGPFSDGADCAAEEGPFPDHEADRAPEIDGPEQDAMEIALSLTPEQGPRLDQALAAAIDPGLGLSRSRLRKLIEAGALTGPDGAPLLDPSHRLRAPLDARLTPPPPVAAEPEPEVIPLDVAHEDDDVLVVVKPAGMAAHPAPGSERGTLVNAALAHCAGRLSGVGGVLRPGVVHRLDKDTSGLLVLAKSDRAHQSLAAQFADHSIERVYQALAWGGPDRGDPRLRGLPGVDFDHRGDDPELWGRVETEIARSRTDRKKMAVVSSGGKRAVTWWRVAERFGPPEASSGRAAACRLICQLETGRTHQIRVHMAYLGHGLIGDPLYGRASMSRKSALPDGAGQTAAAFGRQALHAGFLAFTHPRTGERLRFERPPPADFRALAAQLRGSAGEISPEKG